MAGLVCPWCNVSTSFTPAMIRLPEYISGEPQYVPAVVEETIGGPPIRGAQRMKGIDNYAILQCQGCRALFVAREEAPSKWEAVYPIPRKTAPKEVPEPIKGEFEEASLCFAVGAYSDLPPSNEASYNIVKRGTKNAEERVYTGTDYQQTQGS